MAKEKNRALGEKHARSSPVELPPGCARSARVDETNPFDFPNKTLIIEFRHPMYVPSKMRLSPRARPRALVTATEGKTATLRDLDLRSFCSRCRCRTTGMGTDETVVVEGTGKPIDDGD